MSANLHEHRDKSVLSEAVALPRLDLESVLLFLAFTAAYFIAYRFGMSFSHATASPFWFPDSVLLCALLKARPRYWWILILTTLPIRQFSDVARELPQWFLVSSFAIDSAKGVAAALILCRLMDNPLNPKTVRDLVVFTLAAVLLVPLASAFPGAGLRGLMGYPYWRSVQTWFLGDALAQLIVTPFLLYWVLNIPWRDWIDDRRHYPEMAILLAGLILTGYLAAYTPAGSIYYATARFYAPVPFLFWAAIRFGLPGAAGAMTIISGFTVAAAIFGNGPFVGQSPAGTALSLQNFLLLRAVPLYIVAAFIDRMRAAELAVRESEERFRFMAQNAPMLMWMTGIHGGGDFFNQVWLDFTGRTPEQEAGEGWTQGIHPDDFNYCVDIYTSAFDARRPFELEYRLRRHDGEYRWILDKGVPRHAQNGEFIGYIGSAIDITELKRAQETNHALAHTHRLAVMGELTAAIAHEVRQPLSAISLNAQAAAKLIATPAAPLHDLRDMVQDIRANVVRADAVISRIREFLRKREADMQPIDPNVIALDVLWLIAGDVRRRNVRIMSDLGCELPPVVGDRTQLQQVLLNLVVNAMDAMEGVPESQRRILLQTKLTDDGYVEYAVADHGCGIPPNDLAQVFESFFTTGDDGMGLGLSIARALVEAHQGRIWAENSPGGGAVFRFTVPLATSDECCAVRAGTGSAFG